ncbi:Ent-copalyl diphosphate synthase-like protein [Medicago truncatula]|uniref:Ent-copalyl diphosphate synthase-like protein n=1 Tax=Medicago truncatula TaxID=3880 RepID=A0A072TI65_MEDTR|nr:Ent-copalyl diphosphate synthase-like protein [Medicago truncatula]
MTSSEAEVHQKQKTIRSKISSEAISSPEATNSQVLFQEKILEDAKNFSAKYLKKKRAANELLDKWIITNDLPGKQTLYSCGLCSGCHGMLAYPDYGGENDVWIGKTLYRMPYMTNDVYLELAKLDYNNCQAMHYDEWKEEIQSIFEPERSLERLAWAKTTALLQILESNFKDEETRKGL